MVAKYNELARCVCFWQTKWPPRQRRRIRATNELWSLFIGCQLFRPDVRRGWVNNMGTCHMCVEGGGQWENWIFCMYPEEDKGQGRATDWYVSNYSAGPSVPLTIPSQWPRVSPSGPDWCSLSAGYLCCGETLRKILYHRLYYHKDRVSLLSQSSPAGWVGSFRDGHNNNQSFKGHSGVIPVWIGESVN